MDVGELRRLIAQGETAHVEFKVAPPRVSDLAARVCGFANGDGGAIVLGVADTSWAVVGVKDSAAAVDRLLQACRQCRPPVRLAPPQPVVAQFGVKALVVGHVPPNDGTLHQAGGVFYIRRGTHTVPMDAGEIEAYFHRRGTLAWEARPAALATLDDLDLDQVGAYLAHRPGRRGGARARPTPSRCSVSAVPPRTRAIRARSARRTPACSSSAARRRTSSVTRKSSAFSSATNSACAATSTGVSYTGRHRSRSTRPRSSSRATCASGRAPKASTASTSRTTRSKRCGRRS